MIFYNARIEKKFIRIQQIGAALSLATPVKQPASVCKGELRKETTTVKIKWNNLVSDF